MTPSHEPGASPLSVGVCITSTEHGGAEAHIARIWTDPLIGSRARAHLLGDIPQWPSTGLPATDIGSGAKWSYRRALTSVASMPAVAARGRRTIREVDARERFDAFYAHFKREQVLYTAAMARIAPVIWMEHGHLPEGRLRRPLMAAYRRAARDVSAIVCLSESVAAQLRGVLGDTAPELVVIENAIDPTWTTPADAAGRARARRDLGVPEDAGTVIAVVARLIPRKRIAQAIEAAELMPSAWLVVCGDGPLADELHGQAAGNPRIVFTGFLADPRPVYAAADVLLLASWEEGFGQVLLEGASAGLPGVVVADAGLSGLVEGWGETAEQPTGPSIAEALIRAAARPPEGARAWAEAHGPEAWARRHLDLLERVTGR